MEHEGDTRRQALLRDRMAKKRKQIREDAFVSRILSVLKPGNRLCDIGCGTAHIIQEMAMHSQDAIFLGLDISPAMLDVARANTSGLSNVRLVKGDGFELPFQHCALEVVTARLAECSPREVYRVLRSNGCFFEYGLGPEADKEILEFFPDRIEKENFFFPKDTRGWMEEVCEEIQGAGLALTCIEDFKETDYFQNVEELMDLIEMVPLVEDFDRREDRGRTEELAEKYREREGIGITWHYYIAEARRPR